MMKLFLCLLALTVTATSAYRFASSEDSSIEQQWAKKGLSFGMPNHEYRFNYDVQLNTGFAPWIAEQKAVQRMHAQVRVQFVSERSAVLRMDKVRVAKYNDELESNRVQPMETLENVEIPAEKIEQLEKPVQFTLGDGIVERVHFNREEPVWSRNIKKAVLSLIQLNARKALSFDQEKQLNADEVSRVFTVEESTLEGICQTTYTLAKTSDNELNVTKSIDFEQCRQLADLAYGYQGQQSERQIVEQQQVEKNEQQPVPLEKLSRSTIYRQQWRRVESGKHALKSAEVVSQYTVRSSKTETGMAMQTVTIGRLQLRDVQSKKIEKISEKLDSEESVVYNARFESEEKRFFMYGDELVQSTVFETKQETEKDVAEKILRFVQNLAHQFQKQTQDSKLELVQDMEKTISKIRQLSLKKLESLEEQCSALERVHLYDLCTMAGTRNTIALLTKRMPELAQGKTIQILKSLAGNLIAPSESIAELVLKTCQHFDKKSDSASVQQSCWLSFSAIVGQVSQQQRDAVNSMEYPTRAEEQKQTEKLAQFAKLLKQKLEKAEDKYERILAIKLIGNAGLKQHLELLEKLIRDPKESSFVRTEAVDALRRQRFTQAEKVQQIVMPVFVDTKQPQELRMACLSMLVSTLPAGSNDEKTIIDQIAYTLLNERSEQVRAFTYSLMKNYAKSPIVAEQQLAKHLKNTLKISSIDEEELLQRASRHIRIPIYSQAEKEGLFFGMNAAFVPQSYLPTHMSAYLDSMLNGFVDKHAIYVSVCQHNTEQWIQRIFKQMKNSRVMRSQNRHAQEELKKLIQGLKVEQRSMSEEEPFAMATIRVKDVDQVVLPLNEKLIQQIGSKSEQIKQILSELGISGQTLMTLNEKQIRIPTSAGFGIQMHNIVPVIADLTARMHIKSSEASLELRKAHILAAQQQYMKVICPLTLRHTGVQS